MDKLKFIKIKTSIPQNKLWKKWKRTATQQEKIFTIHISDQGQVSKNKELI